MKKSLLTIALVAAAFGAHATTQPTTTEGAAHSAAAAAPTQSGATVSVTGASTVAGAPLLLSVNGGKAIDPSFQELFDAAQTHKAWRVTNVKSAGEKARMYLESTQGKASIEMDVAADMVKGLKLKKGATIDIETQVSGQGALIKFSKDKTPLGFMVNKNTAVTSQK